jgi:heat shock protein HslJ
MRVRSRAPRRLLASAAALGLACAVFAEGEGDARAASEAPPTLDELASATYAGLQDLAGPVTLRDGLWQGPPVVEGGASRPEVRLVRGFRVTGDVDGDGAPEAVVLLVQSSGGTGSYLYAVVAGRRDGRVSNLGTAFLGDRVQVRAATIDAGRLRVFIVRAGPDDAMCCPGEVTVLGFALRPGAGLEPFAACEHPGRLSPAVLGGVEWVLREWDGGDPAPAVPEVTLTFADGRISGSAGCNRYFASVEAGDTPGAIAVGPVGATRMACPDPIEAVETRFLAALGRVEKFSFLAGRLAFIYPNEAGAASLRFEAHARGAESADALLALFCP